MAEYKTHMKIGIFVGLALTILLVFVSLYTSVTIVGTSVLDDYEIFGITLPVLFVAFPLLVYASLLPDIDMGNSKVYKFTVVILIIRALFIIFTGFVYPYEIVAILLFLMFITFLNHRGVTHQHFIVIGILSAIFIAYIFHSSIIVGLYVFVGYCSHMIGDIKRKH